MPRAWRQQWVAEVLRGTGLESNATTQALAAVGTPERAAPPKVQEPERPTATAHALSCHRKRARRGTVKRKLEDFPFEQGLGAGQFLGLLQRLFLCHVSLLLGVGFPTRWGMQRV